MTGEYVATVTVNRSGRILSADKMFCRMFGFKPSECKWHYICDCVGGVESWAHIRDNLITGDIRAHSRNRRAFRCSIAPVIEIIEGKQAYTCKFTKKQKH